MAVSQRYAVLACALLAIALIAGCSSLGYYAQAVGGHFDIMARREPIDALLADPTLDAELAQRLALVSEIRSFASTELALPDNGSYTSYADIGRPFATWVVVATPEFSVAPRQWCFPVTGCISYRGYFAEEDARAFAETLRADGLDVHVAGSRAYSTLGWFDDPVLNTMVNRPAWSLAGVVFHELAHQQLYAADDSAFSEAYSVAVERAGVRRWLTDTERKEDLRRFEKAISQRAAFTGAVLATRTKLASLYASDLPVAQMRAAKRRAFDELRQRHDALREGWGGTSPYERWFQGHLNNARVALIATYDELVPAFGALLREHGGDFAAFHAACAELAELAPEQRGRRLKALRDAAQS